MNLEVFSKLLEDAGIGTRGTDIFIHRMDADCDQGILIRAPLDGVKVDNNLPGYYQAPFQVIVRALTQAAGDTLAKQVVDALVMQRRTFTAPGGALLMQVNHIYQDKKPIVYLRSDGRLLEWSCNFRMSYVQP